MGPANLKVSTRQATDVHVAASVVTTGLLLADALDTLRANR